MADVYLCLGSNLGDKQHQLNVAIARITEMAGPIPVISDFHESPAWGFQSPNIFLNVVVQLQTQLTPHNLLAVLQQIEREMGRTAQRAGLRYADRTIDIDILMYDNLILHTPDLIIPHPLMHERLFVLLPLAEIAPELLHPVFNQTIAALCSSKP